MNRGCKSEGDSSFSFVSKSRGGCSSGKLLPGQFSDPPYRRPGWSPWRDGGSKHGAEQVSGSTRLEGGIRHFFSSLPGFLPITICL